MKKTAYNTWLCKAGFIMAGTFLLMGCVNDAYDLDKDIDMTMGLGAEGLSVKFGSTEKILLGDILEVDKSVKLDESNTYYLVENGETDVDFKIEPVKVFVEKARLGTTQPVLDIARVKEQLSFIPGIEDFHEVDVPAGMDFQGEAEGRTDFSFSVQGVEEAVKRIAQVYPEENTTISVTLKFIESGDMKFVFEDITDMRISIPKYLRVKKVIDVGHDVHMHGDTIHVMNFHDPSNHELFKIEVDHAELSEDGVIENGTIDLSGEITMKGTFHFVTKENFPMTETDHADIAIEFAISGTEHLDQGELIVDKVVGEFDPDIAPEIESIDIASELPDFLQDEEVRIGVANPTLKLRANMTDIPMSLDFKGKLIAQKNAPGFPKVVSIPEEGIVELPQFTDNWLYFYQGAMPYDPVAQQENAARYTVSNLSDLIKELPNKIDVDLGNKSIRVKQGELFTLHLGDNYHADIEYDIYVPFEFNNGLKIVYNDSTDSMGDDLEDFEAEGLTVTATLVSTIPLKLNASLIPVDKNGRALENISVTPVQMEASDGETAIEQPVEIAIQLNNPKDLKRVDRLKFKVNADGSMPEGATRTLRSDQYLQVKDARLRLDGQVIADFNDDED